MIRKARAQEVWAVWTLVKALHAEQALFRLNQDKALDAVTDAVADGRCFVSEEDGGITGYGAYRLGEDWYSDETVMIDMGLYVVPEHRHSRTALALRNALKREAKTKSLRFLPGCVGTGDNGARLYAHGFDLVGHIFEAR